MLQVRGGGWKEFGIIELWIQRAALVSFFLGTDIMSHVNVFQWELSLSISVNSCWLEMLAFFKAAESLPLSTWPFITGRRWALFGKMVCVCVTLWILVLAKVRIDWYQIKRPLISIFKWLYRLLKPPLSASLVMCRQKIGWGTSEQSDSGLIGSTCTVRTRKLHSNILWPGGRRCACHKQFSLAFDYLCHHSLFFLFQSYCMSFHK